VLKNSPTQGLCSPVQVPSVRQNLSTERSGVPSNKYPFGHSNEQRVLNRNSFVTHSAGVTWLSEIEFSFGHLTAASKKKKHIIMICFSVLYLFYIQVCRDVLFYLNLITPTSLFKGTGFMDEH